jgi:hypothetical protein
VTRHHTEDPAERERVLSILRHQRGLAYSPGDSINSSDPSRPHWTAADLAPLRAQVDAEVAADEGGP